MIERLLEVMVVGDRHVTHQLGARSQLLDRSGHGGDDHQAAPELMLAQ